jgi:hypothetical protein
MNNGLTKSIALLATACLLFPACRPDEPDPSENSTSNNNTAANNQTTGNNTTANNQTAGNNTTANNQTSANNATTGNNTSANNTVANNQTAGNNATTGNNTTPGNNTTANNTTPGVIDSKDIIFMARSGDCADYAAEYAASVSDVQRSSMFTSEVTITAGMEDCTLISNAIPNHDFNDPSAMFAHDVSAKQRTFNLPRNPEVADMPTALSLMTYDAIFLNGVPVDLLSAGCHGVGDGKIGCFDLSTPYRYDPLGPGADFGTDMHNAHTQPDGTYHYHGNPMALFDDMPGEQGSPVIGFAADGFPIYGPFFNDGAEVRRAISGYSLKQGTRDGGPGGTYDGTFIDDYEFTDAGDLDECNGMTVDGQYGYYVTDAYPWVVGCLSGTPDPSFSKGMGMMMP